MARRTNLREYQIAVADRLKQLTREGGQVASKLGFVAGGINWFVNLYDVAEVLPVPPVVPIPLTKPYFHGMCNVRGNLYGIIDFSAFLGAGAVPQAIESRLLLLPASRIQGAALLVNRMAGLRNPEAFSEPTKPPDAAPWVAAEYRDMDGVKWCELDVDALAQHEQFLNVGR